MPEDERERLNRELIELLNELRVALPGVQVLFAFLLAVPFANGFPRLGKLDRDVFFAAFIATALSTVFLIAPSSYHRIHFRRHDKERLLTTSSRLALAGTVFLALAIAGVVFLITDILYRVAVAASITAVAAAWFAWLWYGLPLRTAYLDRRR